MTAPIAIVVSEFNQEITSELLSGTIQRLKEKGYNDQHIKTVSVPGAVEIPFIAQRLAKSKQYAAIICLGCVIRGDTDHYDYVCDQVSQGCQRIMLDHDVPVIFGLLTTNTFEQAKDRIGGKEGHKGRDAADTALTMIERVRELNN